MVSLQFSSSFASHFLSLLSIFKSPKFAVSHRPSTSSASIEPLLSTIPFACHFLTTSQRKMSSHDVDMANNGFTLPGLQHQEQQQQPEGARPPPKRRNRKAVSCVSCREKKIKCDRVVPCNQCVKRGEQDQCRIEQKPKIIHDHAHAHSHAQHNYVDPLSPGSAAYTQFSAAISTTKDQVNAAQSTGSPPPAEVEAIKARLAQVEALLAGQMPLSSANALAPPSPVGSSNWNAYRSSSGSGPGQLSLSRTGSNSPASQFAGHRSSSSAHTSSISPLGPPEDTDESDQDDDTAPSSRVA